ncbi:hypothetical protein JL720_17108 [Aureococcus anophagefferens]|nr:hypothetical protein JL720_17108 [Aureococcus anophagefferens]
MKSWRSILALLCAAAPTSALKNVVVLGSGDPWLSLCTAKTASARGLPATCVSNNEPEALKMLWGKGFDGASPVKVVNGPDAIGEALADCEGLVLNGAEFGGLTDRFAAIALDNGPALKKVAVCVEAGQSKDAVDKTRSMCARATSRVRARVGKLKRRPGETDDGSDDLGLSRHFYDTDADILNYQANQFSDCYCAGAPLAGDAPVNFFQKIAAKQLERADGVSNRAVAAKALVAALFADDVVDLTLNAETGLPGIPADDAAWAAFFADASAGAATITAPTS